MAFEIDNEYSSPHDTAILIDSTDSMGWMIAQFREEAMRLANETFAAGGRVALYDYRDLADPYEPIARCTFETCTIENFEGYLDSIVLSGGGDIPESMLSASLEVMNKLEWRRGATKSLVVLTDAAFLSPDRDGTTMRDVVDLSKRIDPVNLYIITDETIVEMNPEMGELAEATGGMVVTDFGNLNILTERIMDRYDSLPAVEEEADDSKTLPVIENVEIIKNGGEIKIEFKNTGTKAIVILNDVILGVAENQPIAISDLNRSVANELVLVPVDDSRRGERVSVNIPAEDSSDIVVPKTPDTGIAR